MLFANISGCSLVRLKCASGGRESGGSNPLTPTIFNWMKVRNPPAPLSNSLEENNYILQVEQGFYFKIY